jgi:hypothetical protein
VKKAGDRLLSARLLPVASGRRQSGCGRSA